MTRWYFLCLAAVPLLLSFLRTPLQPELVWWTTGPLEKIHPADNDPDQPSRAVKIAAARNEFEPFQVVLRAEGQDIEGVDVEVTDLQGPGTIASKANITIYLERFLDLKTPSSVEGGVGEWPDPLVPRIDRYANEKRNAFPFKAVLGRNQPVWIEVYVPPATPGGAYHGEIHVLAGGKTRAAIPLELQVWNFELPSTSSLATSFGFSGVLGLKAHYGKYTSDTDLYNMTALYQKAALVHRISLEGSSSVAPTITTPNGKVALSWEKYDATMSPFMNGTVFSAGQPLAGAKATSTALRTPPTLKSPDQQVEFWRQAGAHFREKGWFDRLFNYLWDEPKEPDYPAMLRLGETVRRGDPAVKNLVTAQLHPDWSSVIDIWSPGINCFERKPHHADYCTPMVARPEYDSELTKGKELWWYQACNSHGCYTIGGNYFRGWPSYMIDSPGLRSRIMEWLTWKYGVHGELYFSMDDSFRPKMDPWKDVYLYGGNGDGTLFYPGRPNVVGGGTDIPIESIRLKLIREGLEDYEYLTMLTKRLGYDAVAGKVNGFISNTYTFDEDPKKLYAVREWMGKALSGER